MKNFVIIISFIVCLFTFYSCDDKEVEANFEDVEQLTIYDYIVENEEEYSSFLKILEKGGIAKTLSAYNPDGIGYTLFLPNDDAINTFIQENDQFNSLDEMLNNTEYSKAFCKYHVVNLGIHSNDFPFGALPEYTLSYDYLTVSFVIETDTSYYKINNQAPVSRPNIELSNGYIHIIDKALIPITQTTYNWLNNNSGYSIFKAAVDLTGYKEIIDLNVKNEEEDARPFTLMIEHDSIFQKQKINSINDLITQISPINDNYADSDNPLNNFVGYHLLTENRFLDDFVGVASNFSTFSDIPVNINGTGLDILINKGKEVFDTIINGPDTTLIDYIRFNYDASNVLTQSGSIHFIDRILKQQQPSKAIQTFEFYEEQLFDEFREELGSYVIEDSSALEVIEYSGADLFFVQESEESTAWSDDYLQIDGDFKISYQIPKIVQGRYTVILRADAFSQANALIQVFIDGKNVGGLIDLSSGGTANSPFASIELGDIDFLRYENHLVEIRSLIPGRFLWDVIRFEPASNN